MSAKNLFRCLVAISLGSALASIAATHFPGDVPEEWKTLLEWHGNGSVTDDLVANRWLLFGVGIPFLALVALWVVAQIGLFVFWRFARPLYAGLTAAFVLLEPFFGISVLLPIEAAFGELSLITNGAVIALSYSQPFSSYFEA